MLDASEHQTSKGILIMLAENQLTQSSNNLLKVALLANAFFSGLSGLVFVIAAAPLSDFMDLRVEYLVIVGLGLLPYALMLTVAARQTPISLAQVEVFIVMDVLWVLGSIFILAVDLFNLSTGGQWLVLGLADVVLVMAVLQYLGLRRESTERPRYSFEISRRVNVSLDSAWAVVADVAGYADYAPNLSRVEHVSGTGTGETRRCYDYRGLGWNETCVLWQENRRYSYRVDTSDYPYPLRYMQGTWEVQPAGKSTQVTMRFDYTLAMPPLLNWLSNRLYLRPAMQRICTELLDNWESAMISD
jgi:ribosome-associated toxin RatA of RatAB toxin-antitoxin module